MTIRFRAKARSDLAQIFAYSIAEFGEDVARRYKADIDAAFARLVDHSRVGSVVTARPHLRSYPVGEHRIFYAVVERDILIVRILHKTMNVSSQL